MKINRLISVLLLVCFLLVTLVACGGAEDSTTTVKEDVATTEDAASKGTYYLIGMNINIPYWQDHKNGLETAAAELGVEAVFTGENGVDVAKQVDMFEQIVAKKPAGILVCPIDADAMTPSINKAIDAGIPVICFQSDAPNSKRLTYIGAGDFASGYEAANILAAAIGEKGEVGLMTIPGIGVTDARQAGFELALKEKYPNIKLVAVVNDEGDPSKAASVSSQMIQAHPNLVGIFGDDASSGVGAAASLREANKIGKIKVVAFDKDSTLLDLVASGEIEATIMQRTFTMPYYGLKFLVDYNNKSIKLASDMTGINPLPVTVDTGFIVLNKDNVQKYK